MKRSKVDLEALAALTEKLKVAEPEAKLDIMLDYFETLGYKAGIRERATEFLKDPTLYERTHYLIANGIKDGIVFNAYVRFVTRFAHNSQYSYTFYNGFSSAFMVVDGREFVVVGFAPRRTRLKGDENIREVLKSRIDRFLINEKAGVVEPSFETNDALVKFLDTHLKKGGFIYDNKRPTIIYGE